MMRMSCIRVALLVVVAAIASACASYYHVTDPQSGNEYYTDDLKRTEAGSVEFTDAKTGSTVSLPSSEVREINEEEFKANTPKQD